MYKYLKSHEWFCDGKIGISDYAQHELGDIVFVELPEVGTVLKAGESFATIESVKAVSEIYSPVDGEVVSVNEALVDDPAAVNKDAKNSWLVEVKATKESADLLAEADYQEYLKTL